MYPDWFDAGAQREESVIANSSMTLPTYIQPSHHPASHLFSDVPLPSSSSLSSSSHPYLPLPGPSSLSSSSSSSSSNSADCGLSSFPRLYAPAHLAVEPGFLSHGSMGNPAPLTTPMSARYALGGERDLGVGAGLAGSYADASAATYYHYFSNAPDLGPAYTVAGGGGGGGGVPMCGDFMAATGGGGGGSSLLPLSAGSAFTPTRLPVAPSRGKGESSLQSSGGVAGGDGLYGMTDTTPKAAK